jgi:hypothetical protein
MDSLPALCEAAVGVKSFLSYVSAYHGHTDTVQRVPFTSLSALFLG